MTTPSAYRITLAQVRAAFASSMGGHLYLAASSVMYDSVKEETTINSSGLAGSDVDRTGLAGKYTVDHFAGAWVHFRPNLDVSYQSSNHYVTRSAVNGDLVVPGLISDAHAGDFFDLLSTFSPAELDSAMRLGLEEMRLYYKGQYDSDNEKEEIYANGLFESSQIKGVWFRQKVAEDSKGYSNNPWIPLNNWEAFENQGRVFIQVPFEYTPARQFFSDKELRVEYIARYTIGASFTAVPEKQFLMDDQAIVGGDINRQLARCRERLFYARTLSCGAADREYWGMMLQDARLALKASEAERPRLRARKAKLTRWGKYAGQSI